MKKKKLFWVILGIAIILLLVLILFVLHKMKSTRLNGGPSKEIEYQVGNYTNGALFVDGYTYIFADNEQLGCYDDAGEWVPQSNDVMYRVDSKGNSEEFYSFKDFDLVFTNERPYIYYYKGWLYFEAIVPKDTNWDKIFRISEDGKNLEIVYETDSSILFGIRDDYILISDETFVYSIDLKKGIDFSNKEKLETRTFFKQNYYYFFGHWIYNCKNFDVSGYDEYDTSKRQYYDGDIYTILSNDEYDGEKAYERRTLARKIYNENGYKIDELHRDVLSFNIFDGKLYYVVSLGDDNELWCSDIDGSNQERIYVTDFDEKIYCKNIVVGEDNIICDFGPDMDSRITSRCILDKQLKYIEYVSFE